MAITRLRGFQDLLGASARAASTVEGCAREIAWCYNLDEIRVPLMERIELYQRSTGETSDIVSKQMYLVRRSEEGGGEGESMILRPEGTPGVVRAYIEAGLDRTDPYQRFFYSGPMLRYERPQKGRYRQFHQFGVEIFGRTDPACDAELMLMVGDLMRRLELGVRFEINSLGCDRPDCRPRFRAALLEYGRAHLSELCADCHQRLERNPLRLLDCKIDAERVARSAPTSLDYLCEECRAHFAAVQRILSEAGLDYTVKPTLVRGLDYYNRTTFEVVSADVGAQSAIAAGGRYDGLVKELGGAAVAGTGFAVGIERTALALAARESIAAGASDVAIAALGDAAALSAMALAHELRNQGLRVESLPFERKLKALLTLANRMGARNVLIIGDDELARGVAQLRNLTEHAQREVSRATVAEEIRANLAGTRRGDSSPTVDSSRT
ncbi:MAG: histidine--tRNA ligase [Candidatus Binataceae bacterium]